MYIEIEELNSNIYPEIVQMISDGNEQTVLTHINTALSNVKSRLVRYYNIDAEFMKTGNDRNALLVNIAKDLTIYYLYSALDAINNIRVKRYDEAVKLLNEIQQGKTALAGVQIAVTEVSMQEGFANFTIGSTEQRPNELL
jgi:phage gp36-like protein